MMIMHCFVYGRLYTILHKKEDMGFSYDETCSMPCGVLSFSVNSGKRWWSTVLLSVAPDYPCYNVLYDRRFLWLNYLNPIKIYKNPLGSWIQGSAGSVGSLAFFRNIGWIKAKLNQTWKRDIEAISYNRNKWCIFLVLVTILNQRKRWLGSWHMSGYDLQFLRIIRTFSTWFFYPLNARYKVSSCYQWPYATRATWIGG